jgi:hypothetical protein
MKDKDWEPLDKKARRLIRLCLANLVLLNVSKETIMAKHWKKLGYLYQAKSLVNRLFLRKLYALRMGDGDLVAKHLNAFIIISTYGLCSIQFSTYGLYS